MYEVKTLYECEVCGMQSEDQERVAKCKANQTRPMYRIGKKVEFCPLGHDNPDVWLSGEIMELLWLQAGTHRGVYNIQSGDKRIPKIFPGTKDDPVGVFTFSEIAETEIRSVEPI